MIGIGTTIMRNTTRVRYPAVLRTFWQRVKADGGTMVDYNAAIKLYRDSLSYSPTLALSSSAFKAGKLYSVIPSDGSGDFGVSRATASVQLNETTLEAVAANVPVIDTVAGVKGIRVNPQASNLVSRYLGFAHSAWTKTNTRVEGDAATAESELVLNGGFDNSDSWVIRSGWSIADGKANATNTSNILEQSKTLTVNKLYKVQFDLLRESGSFTFSLNGHTISPMITQSGSYIIYYYLISNINNIIYGIASSFTGSVDNVSVKEAQAFADPAGGLNAYKLIAAANNGTIILATPTTVVSGTTYTNLIYAKRVTGTGNVSIIDVNNADRLVTVTDDWTPLIDTRAATSTSGQIGIKLATAGDEILIYNANQAAGVHDRAVTINASLDGTLVTRNDDNPYKTNIAALIGQTEGTVFIECDIQQLGLIRMFWTLQLLHWINESIRIETTLSNLLRINIRSGGNIIIDISSTSVISNGINKIAVAYKTGTNQLVVYRNGVKFIETTVNTLPTMNGVMLGNRSNDLGVLVSEFPINANINDFWLTNTRLSDTELQQLTTL